MNKLQIFEMCFWLFGAADKYLYIHHADEFDWALHKNRIYLKIQYLHDDNNDDDGWCCGQFISFAELNRKNQSTSNYILPVFGHVHSNQ